MNFENSLSEGMESAELAKNVVLLVTVDFSTLVDAEKVNGIVHNDCCGDLGEDRMHTLL
jgi:hypothetical protein